MSSGSPAILQPPFDSRISTLAYPLENAGNGQGSLTRGYMVWEQTIPGFSTLARVDFLYNPSTVEAEFYMGTYGANIQFPNAGDTADLRIMLNETASWSLLYDRTYELWGQYEPSGNPKQSSGADNNNPAVVGVLADIYQMQQFTGMTTSYTTNGKITHKLKTNSLQGRQGILQLIPSYVYFGASKQSLGYYGYITEWDYQITHWTQYMVPMRAVVDITWNMLPYVENTSTVTGQPGNPPNDHKAPGNTYGTTSNVVIPVPPVTTNSGRSGR
jgi:hypothetical protein